MDQGLFQHVPFQDAEVIPRLSPFLFTFDRRPPLLGIQVCYSLSVLSGFITIVTVGFLVIYVNRSWWAQCTGNSADFGSTNPLWVASWASDVGPLPAGWRYCFGSGDFYLKRSGALTGLLSQLCHLLAVRQFWPVSWRPGFVQWQRGWIEHVGHLSAALVCIIISSSRA